MAFLDLTDNLLVNTTALKRFGRDVAIYWSVLQELLLVVRRDKLYDESGFWKIDRQAVKDRTLLTLNEQYECDASLKKANVLISNEDDPDLICVDVNQMISLITTEDLDYLKQFEVAKKKTRAEQAEIKTFSIIKRLKDSVVETDPDLLIAYQKWIDAVYGKVTKKAQVEVFQKTIESYTADRETKLKVIDLAIARSLRDASYAISAYEQDIRSKLVSLGPQVRYSRVSDKKF